MLMAFARIRPRVCAAIAGSADSIGHLACGEADPELQQRVPRRLGGRQRPCRHVVAQALVAGGPERGQRRRGHPGDDRGVVALLGEPRAWWARVTRRSISGVNVRCLARSARRRA